MGLLLFVVLLPICALVALRRRRTPKPLVVPIVLIVYSSVAGAWFLLTVVHLFASLARLPDPSSKATMLGMGISQMMNAAAFGVIVNVPLMIGAYFIDRWLVRRSAAT